jgi:sulfoxide reductase heme-binding subunit YedZ
MNKLQLSPLQWLVHIGAWLPLASLAWGYASDNLTINPIQAATQRSGVFALTFLVLSLACTPLNTLFGWREPLKVRRALGLYGFGYASLHLTLFVGVDYGFDWGLLVREALNKRYILVGIAAFSLLSLLAATSFRWWMVRLGKNWKRLHRLVYLAVPLVVVHFFWVVKGDVLQLSGSIGQPLLYGGIVAVLLALRLPGVRRRVSGLRLSRYLRLPARTARPSENS